MPDKSRVSHSIGEGTIIEPKYPPEIRKHVDFKFTIEIPEFEPEDIIKKIKEISGEEGLSPADFEYIKVDGDDQDNLVALTAAVKSQVARNNNCGQLIYAFMVEGDHGEEGGVVPYTCILRLSAPIDKPQKIAEAKLMLVYDPKRKVWVKPEGEQD